VAQVMASGTWLQGTLVARGLAVASTMPGETECLVDLLAAERAARARRLGIWVNPGEFVAQSRDLATLQAKRGRYLAVEGVIISVGVRDYATFLNLGARWTEDVAVVVMKADRDRIERIVGPLPALRGRGIRVRGVLATSGPPRVRIAEGAALELMD
jgi:endonuclease YncB( thermonuclease family)